MNGITTTMFGSPADVAYGVRVGADGRIVVVGVTNAGTEQWKFALAGYTPDGGTDFFFGDSGRLHTGIGKGSRAGGYLAVREDGTISVLGWDADDAFAARRFNAAGRNPTDPLAGQSSTDSSTGAEWSSASYGVGAPGVSGSGSVNEGSQYSVTLPSVPDRQVSWGDGTIDTIPDGQPDAQHTYDDGPNTYNVFASTHPGPISVASGGLRSFIDEIGTVITDSVSLTEDGSGNPTAELDLNTNDLVVDYAAAGPSPYAALRRWAYYGYNSSGANGITSSAGHGDRILAVVDNAEWNQTAFNGRPVDGSTVIGKYTYFGDADMNGRVTSDDYVAVDVNLGGTNKQWFHGDFSGDGNVTSDEYVAIDANLGKSLPPAHEVTVNNVAPTATINGAPATSTAGTQLNLTSTVTDPSPTDTAAGFAYAWSVTKDDAAYPTGTPTNQASFSFTPSEAGVYVVTLITTDKDDGAGNDDATILVTASAPGMINFSVPSTAQINLDWSDSAMPNVVGYNVYRDSTPSFLPSFENLVGLSLDTSDFVDDLDLDAGTEYFYKIAAIADDGTELVISYTGSASTLTTDTAPPTMPDAITSFAANDTEITLRWSDVSANETAFTVLQSNGAGGWTNVGTTEPNAEGHTIRNLNPETDYTFALQATNTAGPSPTTAPTTVSTRPSDQEYFVILVGGHMQTQGRLDAGNGVGAIRDLLLQDTRLNLNVHVYAEFGANDGINVNGTGQAYTDFMRAFDRGVRRWAIIGYSHGASLAYQFARRIDAENRNRILPARLGFSGSIDGIVRTQADHGPEAIVAERNLPPDSRYHHNEYQRRDWIVKGNTVPGADINQQRLTSNGRPVHHRNIDDDRSLQMGFADNLIEQLQLMGF